uniref:Putative secreted protein n=1 Tax=Panstrongylus lignarius TaxID=156445 RepID=A0A224XT61_9HEMI
MWFNFLLILCIGCCCECMLVKSWGTGLKINQLRWSINDIFSEAVHLMTLGLKNMYPVQGFITKFNTSDGTFVHFETYNGWLEDLQLEFINSPGMDLRRVVMTRAERYLHEKAAGIKDKVKDNTHERGHQHEMIICLECMALTFKSLNYAYRAEMNSTEDSITDPILLWTAGILRKEYPISIPITFQMSIMISHVHKNDQEITINSTDKANSKKQCIILMEPLQLPPLQKFEPVSATKISRFSFLADHIDKWLEHNFNNSTLTVLRTALDTSVRKVLHTRNICLEILLKDSDYAHD